MLFVDGAYLSRPYKGTLKGLVALSADNHLFDVAYVVVSSENNDDWEWFLTVLHKCLGGIQLIIISDRHQSLQYAMTKVFSIKSHTYCLRHLRESFLAHIRKYGLNKKKCQKNSVIQAVMILHIK